MLVVDIRAVDAAGDDPHLWAVSALLWVDIRTSTILGDTLPGDLRVVGWFGSDGKGER